MCREQSLGSGPGVQLIMCHGARGNYLNWRELLPMASQGYLIHVVSSDTQTWCWMRCEASPGAVSWWCTIQLICPLGAVHSLTGLTTPPLADWQIRSPEHLYRLTDRIIPFQYNIMYRWWMNDGDKMKRWKLKWNLKFRVHKERQSTLPVY